MIGTVTRVDGDSVWVTVAAILPGIELGPLLTVVHRYKDDAPGLTQHLTTYLAGDRVLVVEDTPNEFVIIGIVQGG